MSQRRARCVAAIGIGGLAALALAYWLTAETAPTIGVRWRDDVSAARQAYVERQYLLVDPSPPRPDSPRSIAYTLLDTSARNLEAIVNAPEIADTNGIDRKRYEVESVAERAERQTWIAYRTPGLRQAAVLWTLIVALAVMAIAGLRVIAAVHGSIAALRGGVRRVSGRLFDARLLAIIGIAGLCGALGYWTVTPSGIRIRWQDDVSAERQAELERRYQLAGGGSPHSDAPRSLVYALVDASRRNVEAIVNDPEIADTGGIDRELYEVQGLRRARALRTLNFALAGMAIAGLVILPASRRGIAALRDGLRRNSGDLFDHIPSRFRLLAPYAASRQASGLVRVLTKSFVGGLVLVAVGVPILDTWDTLVLAVSLLAVIFGVARPGAWRLFAATGLVIAVLGLKSVLPRADIAEAHNAFMVLHDGEPLQQGLPAEVYHSWKAQFDALYPPESEPYPAYSWRAHDAVPSTLFARSSDAIWRTAKYSRQMDAIDFDSLPEFRGGFANDVRYNFWAGQLSRESMPFYAMYELTPSSVGSSLQWTGQVFWERANGGFEEIIHRGVAARPITPQDTGKRVYALFVPARDAQVHFHFAPSLTLRVAAWASLGLTMLGAIGVLMLTTRPRWDAYLRALFIFSASCLVMGWFLTATGGPPLGQNYSPLGGGNDGMLHDSYGREMAMLVGQGHVIDALKGGEAVYWFTPGTRYVRMVEKLIFGDTNLLFALLTAGIPIVLFYLIRQMISNRAAWAIVGLFWALPVGHLSFEQYIFNARIGYGEAAGSGLFFLGLVLLLRTQAAWGGSERNRAVVTLAGAALAASMFIRPNFALAVAWLGAAHAWASWRGRDVASISALALGLGLALWMPFHNWYYGRELYLISRAGATTSLPLGAGEYLSALRDVLGGHLETQTVAVTSAQLRGWLWNPGFVDFYAERLMPLAWAIHAVGLVALAVTCWIAFRWVARREVTDVMLAVIAVGCLLAHVPMLLVYSPDYRYATLAWDVSLMVLAAWWLRPTRNFAPIDARL